MEKWIDFSIDVIVAIGHLYAKAEENNKISPFIFDITVYALLGFIPANLNILF